MDLNKFSKPVKEILEKIDQEKKRKKDGVGIKAQILERELGLTAEEFRFIAKQVCSPDAVEEQILQMRGGR